MAKSSRDARQQSGSKPVVENRTTDERVVQSTKKRVFTRVIPLVLVAVMTAFLVLPSAGGIRTALWEKLTGQAKARAGGVRAAMPLEPFLVNLADAEESRFIKTTFQLGLAEEPDKDDRFGVEIAAIRDSIISLLSSKRAEQVLTPEGKDALRREIRSRVNALSSRMKVLEVYIVDFVVQL